MATIEGRGRVERSSADMALVVIAAGRWNCSRTCSTSTSEHLETLSSVAIVAEGSRGLGARDRSVVGDRGGRASPTTVDREQEAVTADLVGFLAAGAMVGFAVLFVFLATACGGGGDTTGGMAEPDSSPAPEEGGAE